MSPADTKRHLANWQDEIDSVARYGVLADLEPDPRLAGVYRRLAAAEERHAGFWEAKLRAADASVPERRPGWRARLLIAVARRFGSQLVLPTLNDLERGDSRGYDSQPAVVASAALSLIGLFTIGALITVFTGRGALFSGGRQVVIGSAAAALTYLVGLAIGGAVGV